MQLETVFIVVRTGFHVGRGEGGLYNVSLQDMDRFKKIFFSFKNQGK